MVATHDASIGRMTGSGNGVPSGNRIVRTTESNSALFMKPINGANAPIASFSNSRNCCRSRCNSPIRPPNSRPDLCGWVANWGIAEDTDQLPGHRSWLGDRIRVEDKIGTLGSQPPDVDPNDIDEVTSQSGRVEAFRIPLANFREGKIQINLEIAAKILAIPRQQVGMAVERGDDDHVTLVGKPFCEPLYSSDLNPSGGFVKSEIAREKFADLISVNQHRMGTFTQLVDQRLGQCGLTCSGKPGYPDHFAVVQSPLPLPINEPQAVQSNEEVDDDVRDT